MPAADNAAMPSSNQEMAPLDSGLRAGASRQRKPGKQADSTDSLVQDATREVAAEDRRGQHGYVSRQTQQDNSMMLVLKAENTELSKQVAAQHTQLKDSEQQKHQYHKQLEKEQRTVDEQKQSLERLVKNQAALQQDKAALHQRLKTAEQNEAAALSQVDALQQQNVALQQEKTAALRQTVLLKQQLTLQAEEKQMEQGDCVISLVYSKPDAESKYAAAVHSFVEPFTSEYIVRTNVLQEPQECKFLLYVKFVGGRLPDEMSDFERFAASAGIPLPICLSKHIHCQKVSSKHLSVSSAWNEYKYVAHQSVAFFAENAIIMAVKFMPNERGEQQMLSSDKFPSGLRSSQGQLTPMVLQMVVDGSYVDGWRHKGGSDINKLNYQALLRALTTIYHGKVCT